MGRPILVIGRPEDLGPSLKDLRSSQDVRQDDVADEVGVASTQIGCWENNRKFPSWRSLINVLTAFDYRVVFMHRRDAENLLKKRSSG